MLRHIVMWRLKAEAEGRSKKANALLIRNALKGLPGKIPEIIRLEMGGDIGTLEGNYDLVLVVDFEDERALASYQVHPEHVKVAKTITELRESRAVIDYIID
jgi:hypothetical protein